MADNLDDEQRAALLVELGLPTIPAVWLRPVPTSGINTKASKIGGKFAWPARVPWPRCQSRDVFNDEEEHQNDFHVPLAQFRKDEFPEIRYPGEADILQLLWCPRFHEDPDTKWGLIGPEVAAAWHQVRDLEDIENPRPSFPEPKLIPTECAFRPLRLDDVPYLHALDDSLKTEVLDQLARAPGEVSPTNRYFDTLGPTPGTKLLGYSDEQGSHFCRCGRPMAHLFTLGVVEVDRANGDWYARFDVPPEQANWQEVRAVGLKSLDGFVHIFYCESCPSRPLKVTTQFG
jgi:hypothetical protein